MTAETIRHTRKEAAALLRISISHLDDLVRENGVPVLRLGRRVLFDAAAIEYLEAACRARQVPKRTVTVTSRKAQRADASQRAYDEVMRLTAPSPKKPRGRKWKRLAKGAKA
jgi:excisionase family DNA binding protein